MEIINFEKGTIEIFFVGNPPHAGFFRNEIRLCLSVVASMGGNIMLHSAGVILDNKTLLITGPSEAGKTTACSLMKKDFFLSDESIFVDGLQGLPLAHSTPFGNFSDGIRSNPIGAVFFLKKSQDFRITSLPFHSAIARFFEEQGHDLRIYYGKKFQGKLFSAIHALFQKVPAYEMAFPKDFVDTEAIKKILRRADRPFD